MYKNIKESEFISLSCVDEEFIGKYEINKLGQIRIKRNKRILSIITKGVDYPKIILRSGKYMRRYFLHVLIAKTFITNDNPILKTQVNHKNLNRFDYSLNNLEWVTPSENLKARGNLNSWNRLIYVKLDEKGSELERIPRQNLTQAQRNSISTAIPKKEKYNGFFWKIIDKDVENYYSKFTKEELQNEIWKEAIGHPGILVSNLGLIKTKRGITIGHLLDSGYRSINLKPHVRVHTIVAETFLLGRKLIKPEVVDHVNCNREFNAVWNLKICKNQKENLSNPLTRQKGNQKKIGKFDLKGNLIKEYESIFSALNDLNLPLNNSKLSMCCREKQVSAYGFLWAYVDGNEKEVIKRKLLLQ